jgi:hypothetical protein
MEKRLRTGALQQRIQPKRDIANTASWMATVNRDISYLRNQAKRYIDERLPEQYEKCLVGLNAITREPWNTAHETEDRREKIQALSLAKDCYSMTLAVVDDTIRFVSSNKIKEELKSARDKDDKESREPDYDEDKDQIEEEQEKETEEITTTNQVF